MERPREMVQITRSAVGSSGTSGPAPGGVIAGRRGGLPGRRAVVGGLLVAAAAVIVFAAALSAAGGHQAPYVVAARALPAGSVIGPGDTTTARLGLSGPAAAGAFAQPGALIGRTLAVAVEPGELIEAPMLGGGPSAALRPVSIPVDADSLVSLAAGEAVDALATPSASATATGTATAPAIAVVVRGATLLSISRSATGLLSGSTGTTVVATLGVTDLGEAEQLIQAAHSGTVELVRAEPGDGSGPGPGPAGSASATGPAGSAGG
jgi:hypothetical protein